MFGYQVRNLCWMGGWGISVFNEAKAQL